MKTKPPARADRAPSDEPLFGAPLSVVNVGLGAFADPLESAGVTVVRVEYTPPARGDESLVAILDLLT